ncbi:MAG: TetR/AcrR family transcriptional regulator [Actinobacteria bacterium]|nr:TetR/AcrR family transcriptional regulator [Actinomycetota bacterium]
MPKLWAKTIETHRDHVREAVLQTTATLVAEHGLRAVTMSQIAEDSGIGRATLYKYFPDVEAILLAWYERQVAAHLDQLLPLREQTVNPCDGLTAVLGAYALIRHEAGRQDHGTDLTALLHRDARLAGPGRELQELFRDLITESAKSGAVRTDVGPDELAAYCLNALAASGALRSRAAVGRLVTVTIAGLQAP